MITHYDDCPAWNAAIEAMRIDGGDFIEFQTGARTDAPGPSQAAA